jgi:hypothetical protein
VDFVQLSSKLIIETQTEVFGAGRSLILGVVLITSHIGAAHGFG